MTLRLRCLAGPNGSGKSTLFASMQEEYKVDFYTFVNADEINVQLVGGQVCYLPFPMQKRSLKTFVRKSSFPEEYKALFVWDRIQVQNVKVSFDKKDLSDKKSEVIATILADFIREMLIARQQSFSFESVFSHPSKIGILKEAQKKGFKNYLYFIATDNPELNQKRVRDRVLQGGHDVPPDKIISRYFRCLENVRQTFPYLYRGFFFDSTESTRYLAEYHSVKQELILHVPDEELPDWFRKYILEEGR